MRIKPTFPIAILLCLLLALPGITVGETAGSISTALLLADYDQFWRTLEESFPFYPLLGEASDVEKVRESNRRLIGPRIQSVGGLFSLLSSVVHQLKRVPHFEMISPGLFTRYREAALAHDLPEKTLLLDPRTQAAYSLLAPENNDELVRTVGPLTEKRYLPEYRAVYFRLPSFAVPSSEAAADNRIALFINRHPEAMHVIFDMTGNSGGNTDYWQHAIVSAFSGPFEWTTRSYLRITPGTENAYAGKPLRPIRELDGSLLPSFVEEFRLTHYVSEVFSFPLAGGSLPRVNRPLLRWVLVDGQVFSAADSFAKFCRDTGFAALVGSTTAGGGALVRGPVVCRLDNTGLLYRFMVETYQNEQGLPSVSAGTSPDFYSSPKLQPLEACLQLIKEWNLIESDD